MNNINRIKQSLFACCMIIAITGTSFAYVISDDLFFPVALSGMQDGQNAVESANGFADGAGFFSVPMNASGLVPGDNLPDFWAMSGGNDALTLENQDNTAVMPEMSTMLLMMTGFFGSLFTIIRNRYNQFRRLLDIALSIIALIITLPVILIAAILIKLDSPGPVFYKQVRVGLNRRRRNESAVEQDRRADDQFGKPFTIYKLRSMRTDAESRGAQWASVNDSRVTRIGLFLRKTRIDEIPQFINVLKGDMSIIGPRPERPVFVQQLNESIREYNKRFDMKPGITGLAQVRYQYASSIEDTRKKLKYDLLYAKKASLLTDMQICLNTIRTILFARGSR